MSKTISNQELEAALKPIADLINKISESLPGKLTADITYDGHVTTILHDDWVLNLKPVKKEEE